MRPSVKYVKEKLGSDLIVAEVGVLKGEFSEELLKELPIKKLFLIDTWTSYFSKETGCFHSYKEMFGYYNEMKKRLAQFDGKVEVIRRSSCVAACEVLKDILFDYVYIDANHDKNFISEDLCFWFPLIRNGGVFAGHDAKYNDVSIALKEFSHAINTVFITDGDDWIIQK